MRCHPFVCHEEEALDDQFVADLLIVLLTVDKAALVVYIHKSARHISVIMALLKFDQE